MRNNCSCFTPTPCPGLNTLHITLAPINHIRRPVCNGACPLGGSGTHNTTRVEKKRSDGESLQVLWALLLSVCFSFLSFLVFYLKCVMFLFSVPRSSPPCSELKEAQRKKKQMKERHRQEESIARAVVVWNTEILPNWENM